MALPVEQPSVLTEVSTLNKRSVRSSVQVLLSNLLIVDLDSSFESQLLSADTMAGKSGNWTYTARRTVPRSTLGGFCERDVCALQDGCEIFAVQFEPARA